jgi:hypothetical protein
MTAGSQFYVVAEVLGKTYTSAGLLLKLGEKGFFPGEFLR